MAATKEKTDFQQEQAQHNNDPVNQPHDVEAMQKTDPMKWPKDNKPEPQLHTQVGDEKKNEESGKVVSQVDPPLISIHPSTGKTLESKKGLDNIKFIDNPNRYQGKGQDFKYPFHDVKIDQGFFIPLEAGQTTDALVADIQKQIYYMQQQTGECEKDEKGDDVWESVVIQTKKRLDGAIQLEPNGKPIVGANQTNRPKLIHSAHFIVRSVMAGDVLTDDEENGEKAETDGALVIRVL